MLCPQVVICIFLFTFALGINIESNDGDNDLVQLHVLFHHGDRTIDKSTIIPRSPYKDEPYLPYGVGQLTNRGKIREFDIGKILRRTYGDFLGDQYHPDLLDARSDDYDRTQTSLQLVLAGLFPPKGVGQWLKGQTWQPIPYTAIPNKYETVMKYSYSDCPAYDRHLANYHSFEEGRALNLQYAELYKILQENTGWTEEEPVLCLNTYFGILLEIEWGLPMQEWIEPIWQNVSECALKAYDASTVSPELRRLAGGRLLKNIINNAKAKANGVLTPQNRKLFLYSGHETTVVWLLRAMNVYKPHFPPYGSYTVIELRKRNETYGLRVLYQDYTSSEPNVLVIPSCTEFCPVDKFEELLKENIITPSDL